MESGTGVARKETDARLILPSQLISENQSRKSKSLAAIALPASLRAEFFSLDVYRLG